MRSHQCQLHAALFDRIDRELKAAFEAFRNPDASLVAAKEEIAREVRDQLLIGSQIAERFHWNSVLFEPLPPHDVRDEEVRIQRSLLGSHLSPSVCNRAAGSPVLRLTAPGSPEEGLSSRHDLRAYSPGK